MNSRRYTVGQLAVEAGTKAVTVRYYEQQGLIASPERSPAGYRIYGRADLERLLFIRRCRHFGFTLEDIRALLVLADEEDAPCARVDHQVARHLGEVRERISELRALETELERLSRSCKGGGVIGNCRIIESLSSRLDTGSDNAGEA
ncbi:MAG TPA: helix-turn-helix domain-containing protein [Wenzhouxiangella sp.]|nr:helix-turn-helix domain-containing protein [Wenzhouxiangella sp.]